MSNEAKIVITGEAEQLVKEYQKIEKENDKLTKKMEAMKRKSSEANREERKRARELESALKKLQSPAEKYNATLKQYKKDLDAGRISQAQFNKLRDEELRKLKASKNATDDMGRSVRVLGKDFKVSERASKAFGTAMKAGVGVATLAVIELHKEFNTFHKRMQEVIETNKNAAGSFAELRANFKGDETITDAQLDKKVLEGAKKTGTSVDVFSKALGPAFSAKGSQSNQFAYEATIAALIFNRDPAQAAALTGAVGDFSKFGESTNPRAILGFLSGSQKSARMLSVDQFAKSATPAVNAVRQTGNTIEESTELFVALANLSADQTGETTSTAVVNLAAKLEKSGVAGNTTTERIKTLQNNPELRKQFFKDNTFEAKATPAIKALLSGDENAMKEYQAAKEGIGSLEAKDDAKNVKNFNTEVRKIRGLDTVGGQFARAINQSKANIENFQLDSGDLARGEAARQLAINTINASEATEFTKKKLRTGFDVAVEAQVAGRGADRGSASVEIAGNVLEDLKKSVGDRNDKLIDEQIRLLREMNSELTRIRNQNERQAEAAEEANRNRPQQNPIERIPAGRGG